LTKYIKCQHVSAGIFFTEKLSENGFGIISEKQQATVILINKNI
jgi:hypothetical protein